MTGGVRRLVTIVHDRLHPTRSRIALGRAGERRAARWLRRHGYRILARNVRMEGGEIDLVARHRGEHVVIEVKTRCRPDRTDAYAPERALTEAKRRRLRRLAARLARANGWRVVRIERVAIDWPHRRGEGIECRHATMDRLEFDQQASSKSAR